MTYNQCQSCNGVYANAQGDGSQYFHECHGNIPAAQRRNENLPSTAETMKGKQISAGAGVKLNVAAPKPIVIGGP